MRYNHFTYVDNEIAYFDILDTSYEVSNEHIVHTRIVALLLNVSALWSNTGDANVI